ncbi:MAG: 2,3-bisphosphoglycerate-independent phosphoglycerate mutase [Polyangiaceae bacterium]|nr:2,3-bisphosphoglycerate-independent phosphoglycerate mutase [Polyangiaceae bacterium]
MSSNDVLGPGSHIVPKPMVLLVLDGFGERPEVGDNAIRLAKTPTLDGLYATYPHGLIGTSGPDVGLPPGQMGNSEVGHLNFGAGRIAMMDISRIDNAVFDGSLAETPAFQDLFAKLVASSGNLHLMGLVSDGGIHSMLHHLLALIDAAAKKGIKCIVHAFLDGRDTPPSSAGVYLEVLEKHLGGKGMIGTVSGRYYAMDRDNRWERVEKAFSVISEGARFLAGEKVPSFASALEGLEASYAAGKTDEFVEPFVVGDYSGVRPSDGAIHFNFRPDRARELTRALATDAFSEFPRTRRPFSDFVCMTSYDPRLGLPIAFAKEAFVNTLPEVLAKHGRTQFRCAETEKYAHVTYFFNGGREEPFTGEERKMVPSPKDVATYDLKPVMSLEAVTQEVVKAIASGRYDFILVNFANPDMIGHTGFLSAAVEAVEAVDHAIALVTKATLDAGGALMISADHGNCETMKDPVTGLPHTAHTTNPVPFLYVGQDAKGKRVRNGGRLCDVAPTILERMKLAVPSEMTGRSLFDV